MSDERGRVVLAAVGLVLLAVAAVGWWRAASLDSEIDAAREEASALRENLTRLTDVVERTRDDLLRAEERLETARQRMLSAAADVRATQDCLGLVADEDIAGSQTVVFGFVALGDGRQLSVDEAEWYVGDEATREAIADGMIERGDTIPNDYYIRNDDRAPVSLAVAHDVVIVTTTAAHRGGIPAPKCKTWGRFSAALVDPEPWEESLKRSPYWLTARNDEIVRIAEQYLP
jgi:hypothetical protein